MEMAVGLVSLLAVLFLVSRGLPGRQWPVVLAGVLLVVLVVVFTERMGYWPQSWKTN